MHRRLMIAVLVATLGFAASGCLALPGSTGQIALIDTTTVNGWRLDTYRNTAYPCSISGYQTFTIGTRIDTLPSTTAPLWVFLHGGGSGFFDTSGEPQPDATQMTEEPAAAQRNNLMTSTGLLGQVRADPLGYRLLAVSYCNRDGYGGTGQVDPDNPNLLADGSSRRTNGMLATKAAIQYTMANHTTSATILHGASAGSAGAYEVAWGLQLQGAPPAGVVADASVLNIEATAAAYAQGACTQAGDSPAGQEALGAHVDPVVASTANEPDRLVADGRLTVPLLHIWNHDDVRSCGNHVLACPLRDGTTVTATVTDCKHAPLAAAIEAQGAATTSRNLPLCVTTGDHAYPCDKHQVTIAAVGLSNTDPSSPADYMTTIMQWADARAANA